MRCEQIMVCLGIPGDPLGFAGQEMLNKNVKDQKKSVPNDSLCSNSENECPKHMFILSMSGNMGIFMLR